ncbi:MAG: hypothetical protein JJV95_01055 [Sulfurospirillum sp.]|nr:hypothetical protein [Sulfurospirillum sp.]MBL0702557.1 hypothetical protein [Sulfurospirillum sp.]
MQIVLFLIFVLLILLVVVSKKNSFSKNEKVATTIVVAVFAIGIYIYESSVDNSAEYDREIVNAFRQGKTLTCEEHKIDKETFLYISGTQTFMPQKSEIDLEGIIVKVSTCKVD